jgi:hypothetical protein
MWTARLRESCTNRGSRSLGLCSAWSESTLHWHCFVWFLYRRWYWQSDGFFAARSVPATHAHVTRRADSRKVTLQLRMTLIRECRPPRDSTVIVCSIFSTSSQLMETFGRSSRAVQPPPVVRSESLGFPCLERPPLDLDLNR